MKSIAHDDSDRNGNEPAPADPLTKLLGSAIALAITRPDVIAALREAFGPKEEAPKLLNAAQLAKALNASKATVLRLAKEPGAPITFTGNSRRFELATFEAWLKTRGQKAALAKAPVEPDEDPIDVSAVARRAGLRTVGGGR